MEEGDIEIGVCKVVKLEAGIKSQEGSLKKGGIVRNTKLLFDQHLYCKSEKNMWRKVTFLTKCLSSIFCLIWPWKPAKNDPDIIHKNTQRVPLCQNPIRCRILTPSASPLWPSKLGPKNSWFLSHCPHPLHLLTDLLFSRKFILTHRHKTDFYHLLFCWNTIRHWLIFTDWPSPLERAPKPPKILSFLWPQIFFFGGLYFQRRSARPKAAHGLAKAAWRTGPGKKSRRKWMNRSLVRERPVGLWMVISSSKYTSFKQNQFRFVNKYSTVQTKVNNQVEARHKQSL